MATLKSITRYKKTWRTGQLPYTISGRFFKNCYVIVRGRCFVWHFVQPIRTIHTIFFSRWELKMDSSSTGSDLLWLVMFFSSRDMYFCADNNRDVPVVCQLFRKEFLKGNTSFWCCCQILFLFLLLSVVTSVRCFRMKTCCNHKSTEWCSACARPV